MGFYNFITNGGYMLLLFSGFIQDASIDFFSFESGDIALGFHLCKMSNSQLTQNFFKIRMHISFFDYGASSCCTQFMISLLHKCGSFKVARSRMMTGRSVHLQHKINSVGYSSLFFLCQFFRNFCRAFNRFIFCLDFFSSHKLFLFFLHTTQIL